MINRYDFFAFILYIAILLTNIIVLFTVSSADDHNYNSDNFPGNDLMIFLGFVIITLSVIMYILSVLSSYPVIVFDLMHNKYNADVYSSESTKEIQGTVMLNNSVERSNMDTKLTSPPYVKYLMYVIFNAENLVNILIIVLASLG